MNWLKRKFSNVVVNLKDRRLSDIESDIEKLRNYVQEHTFVSHSDEVVHVELLKRLAVLEDVTDKIEHRRITEEVIAKRQQLMESLAGLNREGRVAVVIQAQIDILDWVLGGKDE